MQEFLCLGDQKKLIKVDLSRVKYLMEHEFSFADLQAYVSSVAEESLKNGQGLGRFDLG